MNWAALFTIYGFLSPNCYCCCCCNWSIDIAANFPLPHTWINHNSQSTISKFTIQKIQDIKFTIHNIKIPVHNWKSSSNLELELLDIWEEWLPCAHSWVDPDFIVIVIIIGSPHPHNHLACHPHHPHLAHPHHDEKGAADQREGGLCRGKCD